MPYRCMNKINYRETFYFPDIPTQPYPVYLIGRSGRLVNFKSVIYPNQKSAKRYTRNKQLRNRSMQAKIFDALVRIGYFKPLTVYVEFPVPIQNVYRTTQKRLYYLLDYYFPELNFAVELDSDYHDQKKDKLRDEYLKDAHGIEVYRIRDLQLPRVQTKEFPLLVEHMKTLTPHKYPPLIFTNDLCNYLQSRGL